MSGTTPEQELLAVDDRRLPDTAKAYVGESRWIRKKHKKTLSPAVLARLEQLEGEVAAKFAGPAAELRPPLTELVKAVEIDLTHYRRSQMTEMLELLGVAFLLAIFIRTFVVQAYVIPSESMVPTLLKKDYLLVWKPAYGIKIPFEHKWLARWGSPRRWDVVVFVPPQELSKPFTKQEDFIKRVVGLPGDTIELVGRTLYINNEAVQDKWGHWADGDMTDHGEFGPFTVPPGHYFMMGDNRDRSLDSRSWGTVPEDALVGPAAFIYFSKEEEGFFDFRWRRLGRFIH